MEDYTAGPRDPAAENRPQRQMPAAQGGGNPPSEESPKDGPAARGELGPLVQQLGPQLQQEFDELAKHEERILKLLSDEELHARFLKDPVGVLEQHDIPVGPIIRRRLKRLMTGEEPSPSVISLPNGQVLKPNVRIRITGTAQKPEVRIRITGK
jgi:hypothetical protein